MLAHGKVEIFPTLRAQPFAIGLAYRGDGHFQKEIFPDQRRQVDGAIFREQQSGFGKCSFVEGIQFVKLGIERLLGGFEAARTFYIHLALKFSLQENPLRRPVDAGHAGEILYSEFFI